MNKYMPGEPGEPWEAEKGEELAELLGLKRNKRGWFVTASGQKSSVGLFRAVENFMKIAKIEEV